MQRSLGAGSRHITRKKKSLFGSFFILVRVTGLEPARGVPPDPKSGASANSATPAKTLNILTQKTKKVNSVYNLKCFLCKNRLKLSRSFQPIDYSVQKEHKQDTDAEQRELGGGVAVDKVIGYQHRALSKVDVYAEFAEKVEDPTLNG